MNISRELNVKVKTDASGVKMAGVRQEIKSVGKDAKSSSMSLKSLLKDLNSVAGKKSLLGQSLKLAAGGGAIAAVNMLGKEFAAATDHFKTLNAEMAIGKKNWREMTQEMILSIPLAGNFIKGLVNIQDAITGKAVKDELDAMSRDVADKVQKQSQGLNVDASKNDADAEAEMKRKRQAERRKGLSGFGLKWFDNDKSAQDEFDTADKRKRDFGAKHADTYKEQSRLKEEIERVNKIVAEQQRDANQAAFQARNKAGTLSWQETESQIRQMYERFDKSSLPAADDTYEKYLAQVLAADDNLRKLKESGSKAPAATPVQTQQSEYLDNLIAQKAKLDAVLAGTEYSVNDTKGKEETNAFHALWRGRVEIVKTEGANLLTATKDFIVKKLRLDQQVNPAQREQDNAAVTARINATKKGYEKELAIFEHQQLQERQLAARNGVDMGQLREKQANDRKSFDDTYKEANQTPIAKFKANMDEQKTLFSKGIIDPEQLRERTKEAMKTLRSEVDSTSMVRPYAQLMIAGSGDAKRAAYESSRSSLESLTQKQLDAQKEANAYLKKIASNNNQTTVVSIP